jgi:hypothetical protein
MPTACCQYLPILCARSPRTVAERIHRHQHVSNVCLCLCQSLCPSIHVYWAGAGHALGSTHVNFSILEALLQILVDSLVRDFANQGEIRDSDFLLFGALEDGLLGELRLWLSTAAGILLAPCTLRYCLYWTPVSASRGGLRMSKLGPGTMAAAQLRAQKVARVSQSGRRVCAAGSEYTDSYECRATARVNVKSVKCVAARLYMCKISGQRP